MIHLEGQRLDEAIRKSGFGRVERYCQTCLWPESCCTCGPKPNPVWASNPWKDNQWHSSSSS